MNRQSSYSIKNCQDGFTLIEILIAVSIFTIGILAANAMQIGGITWNSRANDLSQRTTWAADSVEILIGLGHSDADLNDDDFDGTDEDANSDGVDDDGGNFGLDDAQCCPDGNDPNGVVVTGCTALADGCVAHDQYFVYWNVAVNHPFPDIKTINVIVSRQDGRLTNSNITYMKSNSL